MKPEAPRIEPRPARKGRRRKTLQTSLPPKTLVGFLAATAAVIVIALLSYRSFQGRAESAQRTAHTVEAIHHIETLLFLVADAETGQRGYLLTGMDRYLESYDLAVKMLPHELDETRRAIADVPNQVQRLALLEHVVKEKLAELQQTIDLRRADRAEDAMKIVRTNHGKEAMERIRALVAEMTAAERTIHAARIEELERATSVFTGITWAGSAFLLFLIGASAIMTSRDFGKQQIEAWIQAGQTELALRTQGELSLENLADNIAGFLATYLDAQVGVLYFAGPGRELRRVGGYAMTGAPSSSREGAQPGGLTRQVLEDNRLLYVSDVPDDYFPVTSGLGESKPRHLLVAPASVDGVANAVLELGFFREVGPHARELVRRAAEPVGVALRSSRLRAELRDLLEETQRQAEELQTQQEELRTSNEELEQQTNTLQESQERLKNQHVELEQINSQLEDQAQTLQRERDSLARTQGELQRASTYKSEFLANMSHELRTPLNSSLILAKLLVDNRDGNLTAEQIKFAQTIYAAGNDLLTLINDILDLSKIEAGKLDVRPEPVHLQRLLDDLLEGFRPVANDKALELTVKAREGLPGFIQTDPTRLQQILKNLLSNALKFTERGGVWLEVGRFLDGRIAFAVKDTGIGIAADQHRAIFEAFRQADGTTNRKFGGTGLGLSISRDLAALLGGELILESAPGRGSTFTLLLPERYVARDDARAPLATSSAPRPRAPDALAQAKAAPAPTHTFDDREQIASGGRTLLIVEDDLSFARVIYDLAHERDFQALLAQSAEEGLQLAERYRPSAVVLDVGLPDRSGLSVLDALKHNPTTRHIPVHMISVSDYTQTALGMGAAGYAIKPILREQLVEAIARLERKITQDLKRVLVVEDDDTHRDSTCRLLSADNVETVAVGTAAEALAQLSASTFDCMVLDLSLPDRTGFELLEEMAQREQYSFPPVIVYTGRSLSREEEQNLRRFSTSIIVKGARSPERLLDEVTLFLHQVEADLPVDRQRMLRDARHREKIFEGRRVLVVEDDVRNIFALTSVLEPKGAKVEIARNGHEAIAHLVDQPGVDLVLMDIMMPVMDGLQAMREIRKDPALAKLPIIALTAKAMADDRESCLAAGANDYVAKPLDVDKLISLARVWMPK